MSTGEVKITGTLCQAAMLHVAMPNSTTGDGRCARPNPICGEVVAIIMMLRSLIRAFIQRPMTAFMNSIFSSSNWRQFAAKSFTTLPWWST